MSNVLAMLVQSRPNGKPNRGDAIVERQNDDFFALYLILYQLLADREIEGVKRDVSKVSIKLQPEGWVCSLTEPASGQVLFSRSESLLSCFEVLEGRLSSGDADWRLDKYAKVRKERK